MNYIIKITTFIFVILFCISVSYAGSYRKGPTKCSEKLSCSERKDRCYIGCAEGCPTKKTSCIKRCGRKYNECKR
jgi:hypothetical protein